MDKNLKQGVFNLSLVSKSQGAFLGSAVGDALGWPQEDRAQRVGEPATRQDGRGLLFQTWVRRSGGRFLAHEETILPGEYSDDTQLILSVARSRLRGSNWWEHLVARELPTWSLYERGGGGATKRAVDSWVSGRPPWTGDRRRTEGSMYFQAGGNGVAMRIAPHCVIGAKSENFSRVGTNIILDGIATHGHPRALLGANAYGYALWTALRQTDTLKYGQLIKKTLSGSDEWSRLPDVENFPHGWSKAASELTQDGYKRIWAQTVREMVSLLEIAEQGLGEGALSIDREILEKMGCFDRKTNGSGTIAAASSVFLASRYAADPLHGFLEAAFSKGADTDTIASMMGGILGALAGIEAIKELSEGIQDGEYLRSIAEQAAAFEVTEDTLHPIDQVTKSSL